MVNNNDLEFDSKDLFRKLFEDSVDATLIIEDNKFVDCNKATLKMLRIDSKEQVLNTRVFSIILMYYPNLLLET